MYLAQNLKNRINAACKSKGTTAAQVLQKCGFGQNSIVTISDKGGMMAFRLAAIADQLECSVDYLLGRTDDPFIGGRSSVPDYVNTLESLPDDDKAEVIAIIEMKAKKAK